MHKTSRYSQALLHERFTNKWWLSLKIETWNFIKNKLLQFKENGRCICRLKCEHIIKKRAPEKCTFHG